MRDSAADVKPFPVPVVSESLETSAPNVKL